MNFITVLYIALGSAVGGVARAVLSVAIGGRAGTPFPIATLLINVTGSFVLGFVMRYALETTAITPEIRALLTTGFCGGFTTFSTFSFESARLIQDGDYSRAASYIVLSVLLALAGMFGGFGSARALLVARRGG